jgi:hypothetical protein
MTGRADHGRNVPAFPEFVRAVRNHTSAGVTDPAGGGR